jgi:flavin reductase (NADH)
VDLRKLRAVFPTGVTIVTAFDADGCPRGMTCTAMCVASVEPPVVLVCIRHESPTLRAIVDGQSFAINLLSADAEDAARLFASGEPNRFEMIHWSAAVDSGGPRLTSHAHTVADCRVRQLVPMGDHAVVFGTVTRVSGLARPPLLYGFRQYATWPSD